MGISILFFLKNQDLREIKKASKNEAFDKNFELSSSSRNPFLRQIQNR